MPCSDVEERSKQTIIVFSRSHDIRNGTDQYSYIIERQGKRSQIAIETTTETTTTIKSDGSENSSIIITQTSARSILIKRIKSNEPLSSDKSKKRKFDVAKNLKAVVLWDFKAEHDDELDLLKGQEVTMKREEYRLVILNYLNIL